MYTWLCMYVNLRKWEKGLLRNRPPISFPCNGSVTRTTWLSKGAKGHYRIYICEKSLSSPFLSSADSIVMSSLSQGEATSP